MIKKITKGEMLQEDMGTKPSCSKDLAEHHQGRNPAWGQVSGFQISTSH